MLPSVSLCLKKGFPPCSPASTNSPSRPPHCSAAPPVELSTMVAATRRRLKPSEIVSYHQNPFFGVTSLQFLICLSPIVLTGRNKRGQRTREDKASQPFECWKAELFQKIHKQCLLSMSKGRGRALAGVVFSLSPPPQPTLAMP